MSRVTGRIVSELCMYEQPIKSDWIEFHFIGLILFAMDACFFLLLIANIEVTRLSGKRKLLLSSRNEQQPISLVPRLILRGMHIL